MALLRFYNPVPTSYRWNDVYNPYNEFERHFNPANNCYCGDDRLPSANISESDSEYRIMMALPGVDKDKISINLDKGVLSVKVENNEQKEEDTVYSYREFNVADASRSFRLGPKVDTEKINAEFKNGILTLTLPKKQEYLVKPACEITVE